MSLRDLWSVVSGRRVQPKAGVDFTASMPPDDPPDSVEPPSDGPPRWGVQSISGLTLIMTYRDSKGAISNRRISCKRIEDRKGKPYLVAWCFERSASRTFLIGNIIEAADIETGEVYGDPQALLAAFRPDVQADSAWRYGLSPRDYAMLNAALNVLTFIARCDRDWHPEEEAVIRDFVPHYWNRCELTAPYDEREVDRHINRLAPDDETFYVSLERCLTVPTVAKLLRPTIDKVIEADGALDGRELHFRNKVAEWFAEAGY